MKAFPLIFLVRVVLAPLQSGLEAFDHKCHLILIETNRFNLHHLVRERLLIGHRFESNGLRLVVREWSVGDLVDVPRLLCHHAPSHKFIKNFFGRHFGVSGGSYE
jgi:hypothetical protein